MASIDRRTFLARGAAAVGSVALAGPLQAHAARAQAGSPTRTEGYGPLVPAGDLLLPAGFSARVVSRQGDPMSDGNPTPGIFDGMGAFAGPDGTTILMRNHENRSPFFPGFQDEMPVQVPPDKRYDNFGGDQIFKGGVTKVVLGPDLAVRESFAVLGGTTTNCAGGVTPWGSWITCEEVITPFPSTTTVIPPGTPPLPDLSLAKPHGYIYEIDSRTPGPVVAVPVKSAGRFFHEAVAWLDGILYETEDNDVTNPQDAVAFYRYVPDTQPTKAGDLAAADSGRLQALRVTDQPNRDLRTGATVGEALPVEWVTIADPDPATDTVRQEAFSQGAARFTREEGIWIGDGRVFFDCSNGGDAGQGQLFEYDPAASTIKLVYESPAATELKFPDNLVVSQFGDIFVCEDDAEVQPLFVRGVTPDGLIYDFAQSVANTTEFCGACFSPDGQTLFVNQQGGRGDGEPQSVTYAITGPFASRAGLMPDPAPDRDGNRRRRRRRPDDDPRRRTRERGGRGDGDRDPSDDAEVRPLGAGGGSSFDDGGLPFTGLPLHLSAGAGALLAGLGAVLRRRMRAAEPNRGDDTVD